MAIAFLFAFVLGRLFYVQVIWGESLQEKAIDQWTREIPIIASRGEIVDVNGVLIASNEDTFTVFVRKKAVSNLEKVSMVLSEVLEINYDYVYERLTKTVSSEVTIKKQVAKEKIDKLLTYGLSGVYYSRDNTRKYLYGDFLSAVLGFTSSDGKGQAGLEAYYDKYLSGINGEILYETDIVGVEIDGGKASYIPATDGLNVKLTIDYDIQQFCESALDEIMQVHTPKSAQILVIDPTCGAIRALAIKPSFNPNEPPRNDLTLLNSLTRNSLFCDMYEPGSTFKIITTSANIEEFNKGNPKAFSTNHIFNSSRYRYIDGQKVKCWNTHNNGKHSMLNIQGALNNSCNPIFVDMAMSLGKKTMYDYINRFNFGKVTGVDFSGESQGMILPESSAQNVDLARIAFGQTIAVTAIQLISAVSAVVNGGNYYKPYLVEEIYDNNGIIVEKTRENIINKTISEATSKTMCELLEGVVAEGSGSQAFIDGYRVFGKTGTAQKYQNGIIAQGKYVSSFIGGFPANAPKYLALIIVDEPTGQYYGSTVAAPYAKSIFQNIIDLKGI